MSQKVFDLPATFTFDLESAYLSNSKRAKGRGENYTDRRESRNAGDAH